MSEIKVLSRTQRIVVDSTRHVSIINAGPVGPPGIQGISAPDNLDALTDVDLTGAVVGNVLALLSPGVWGPVDVNVDDEIVAAVLVETNNRVAADDAIMVLLDSEINRATDAELAISAILDTEVINRTTADNLLEARLDILEPLSVQHTASILANANAIVAETGRAIGIENGLGGDIATLTGLLIDHTSASQNIHGISDTANLVYTNDLRLSNARNPIALSVTNASVAEDAAISYTKLSLVGSITEADLAFSLATQSELDDTNLVLVALGNAFAGHILDTQNVHGITDTANLIYTDDARLTDARNPLALSVTNASVAANAAIAYSKLALGGSITEADLAFSLATQAELDTHTGSAFHPYTNVAKTWTAVQEFAGVMVGGSTGSDSLIYNSTAAFTVMAGPNRTFNLSRNGFVFLNYNAVSTTISASAAGNVAQIIKGFASQTADFLQLQDSAGAIVAQVLSTGFWRGVGMTSVATSRAQLLTNFDTGAIGISTAAAANRGLVIRGAASQTANLLETQSSGGVVKVYIAADGTIATPSGVVGGQINGIAASAATVAIIAKGFASQTASLIELQDSAGAIMTRFDSAGYLGINRAPIFPLTISISTTTNSTVGIAGQRYGLFVLSGESTTVGNVLDVQRAGNVSNYTGGISALYVRNDGFVGINTNAPTGQLQINMGAAGTVGVLVKGFASQTASLTEWQSSGGTVWGSVGGTGKLWWVANDVSIGTNAVATTALSVNPRSAGDKGLVVMGAASQTGNLIEAQNSAGTVLLWVKGNGSILNNYTAIYSDVDAAAFGMRFISIAKTASEKPMVIKGAASQTANLIEVQDSAAAILARVASTGYFFAGAFESLSGRQYLAYEGSSPNNYMRAANAAHVVLVVQGEASQTADLLQLQDSTGAVVASVLASGFFRGVGMTSVATSKTQLLTNFDVGSIGISTMVASNRGLVVRGAASQTANLLETQTSGGTVTSKITATGSIFGDYFQHMSSLSYLLWTAGTPENILVSSAASHVMFVIKGAASQSGDYIQIQDSSAAVQAKLMSDGNWAAAGFRSVTGGKAVIIPNYDTGGLGIITGADANKGLVIRRNSGSQTANLFEAQNEAAGAMVTLTAGGHFRVGNAQMGVGTTTAQTNVNFYSIINTAADVGILVKGKASQTANLIEAQDSAAAVKWRLDPSGGALQFHSGVVAGVAVNNGAAAIGEFGTASASFYAGNMIRMTINRDSPLSNVGLVISAVTSQTGDWTQWVNGAGVKQAWVDSSGGIRTNLYFTNDLSNGGYVLYRNVSPHNSFEASAAGNIPVRIKGFASQTANLLEVQDSASAILTTITAAGKVGIGVVPLFDLDVTKASATGVIVGIKNTSSGTGSYGQLLMKNNASNGLYVNVLSSNWITTGSNVQNAVAIASDMGGGMSIVASNAAGVIRFYSGADTERARFNNLGGLELNGFTAASIGLLIRGAASQTGNYLEVQDSTSAILAKISISGDISGASFRSNASSKAILYPNYDTGGFGINTNADANKGLVIRRNSVTQTANPFEYQSQTGAVISYMFPSGGMDIGVQGAAVNSFFTYLSLGGWKVLGADSPNGTILTWGGYTSSQWIGQRFYASGIKQLELAAGTTTVFASAAANVGQIIKGFASQTAEMFQVQDSASAVLYAITAAGLPKWAAAANVQTTIGAAGGASALPASPDKYLKVVCDDGVTRGIPAFALS